MTHDIAVVPVVPVILDLSAMPSVYALSPFPDFLSCMAVTKSCSHTLSVHVCSSCAILELTSMGPCIGVTTHFTYFSVCLCLCVLHT